MLKYAIQELLIYQKKKSLTEGYQCGSPKVLTTESLVISFFC